MKKIMLLLFLLTWSTVDTGAQSRGSRKQPKNIILMIGDGMGVSQVYAGLVAAKGSLNLERVTFTGFHKNRSANNFITDSGAGATAFAIGKKANNGGIGVDAQGNPQPTILEIAEQNGKATGLLSTCSVTHATPASFIAHQSSRGSVEDIALDFLKTDVDVFVGGGLDHFTKRKDGRNLIDELKAKNYQIAYSIEEVQKTTSGKLAGFLADKEQPKISEGRGDQLLTSVKTSLDILNKNKKGFFLMAEGSQIDWGGHANDTRYIIDEMLDFDKAIGAALDFAEKDGNTLVIITADHETGGFSINGGDFTTGKVEGKFTTGGHTGVMIPVFAYGPGAEVFSGIYENTAIFDKIVRAFRFKSRQQ